MRKCSSPCHVTIAGTLLLVLLAGCVTGIGGSQPSTASYSPQPVNGTSEIPCVQSIGFYSLAPMPNYSQPANEVHIGFIIEGGTHAVFVAYENDTILGTSFSSAEYNTAADGHTVSFTHPLNGTHTVRVVAYEDTNRNQQYDRGTDRPCYVDGEPVQTRWKTFNFSSG